MAETQKTVDIWKLCNEAIAFGNQGNADGARAKLTECLKHQITEQQVLEALLKISFDFGEPQQRIEVCRKAIEAGFRFTSFSSYLMEAIRTSKSPALISDFMSGVDYKKLGVFYFICGFRSSGIEQVELVLAKLLEIPRVSLRNQAYETEQYLFPPVLAQYAGQDHVSGQNLIAAEPDIQLMQAFAIRPVILQRNIFDALYAMKIRAMTANPAFNGAFFGADIKSFDDEKAMKAIIHRFAGSYIQFIVSWDRVAKQARLNIKPISYADFHQDTTTVIEEVLDFYGAEKTRGSIDAWVRPVLGQVDMSGKVLGLGHGVSGMSDEDKQAVIDMTAFYPDVDFRPYGIEVSPTTE